jgi:lipopolysaccharide assembly outer membrane protein LptD (OstA)
LGTNLGIKFFVLLLLVSLSGMAANAFSGEDSRALKKLIPDTIPVQRPANQPVQIPDSLQPAFSPEFFPLTSDPIPGELNDTVPDIPVEPPRQRGSATILDARVDYSAVDSIYFNVRERKVFLYGNADLKYGEIHLEAGYVEIDFRRNELYASGLPDSAGVMQGIPVFTEGPQSFQSKEMWYNFETKRGRTLGVFTEEADGYLHGDIVKIQPSQIIHVQDGKYTTCDDPEPHFHIGFRKAKIIPEDKIITSLAFLVIEGVPTPLVVPFGFFPNKRGQASGILMPSYGETANRGFYLENGGFYWGINDYVDLSLRGDIFTRGSWAARLGSNYRVRYRYQVL